MRAVLDANVVVSGFLQPLGVPGRILSCLVEQAAFELVVSHEILAEYRTTLLYRKIRQRLGAGDEEIAERLGALALLADLVDPSIRVEAVLDDPDDDKYITAALEGRADVVVSGDRHLLEIQHYQEVRIVTPRDFWGLLNG